ncbi:MAG: septum formation protein Maf [Lentisphaeria bacterium]|nr:septum formation protein Maf [Lentisphaeria bacterium]
MLLLASESPRRKELLARLGIPVEARVFPIREFSDGEVPPGELPLRNAELKARATSRNFPDDVVIGADTVILLDGRIIGKPRDLDDARDTLRALSGRTHRVVTGVALLRGGNSPLRRVWSEVTTVRFRELAPAVIETYLRRVNVLDKAGSYAIQEHGELLVDSLDGEVENVIGLPLRRLRIELNALRFAASGGAGGQ